jgi:large subunit ribosomal protein L21
VVCHGLHLALTSSLAMPSAMTQTPVPATAPYAIVEASGQQFWLQPNRYYDIDRLPAEVDSTVNLETVLLVNDGSSPTLGQPYVEGASVELKVMAHRRGSKVIVYKMRPKKKTRRKAGHRQELTRVMVQSITVNGKPLA